MAFDIRAVRSSHGDRYVYYNRLASDEVTHSWLSGIYDSAVERFNARIDAGSKLGDIANYFYRLRNAEYKKEVDLLNKILGPQAIDKYDVDNKEVGKQLITTFNELYNFKEIFEYNVKLITQTQGKKNLLSYFPTYMGQWWETGKVDGVNEKTRDVSGDIVDKPSGKQQIWNIIHKHLKRIKDISNISTEEDEAFQEDIRKVIQKGVSFAVRAMYQFAKPDPKDPDYKPYTELIKEINKLHKSNDPLFGEFVSSLITTYGFDKFADQIIENFKTKNTSELRQSIKDITKDATIFQHSGPKAGLAAEVEAWLTTVLRGVDSKRPIRNIKPDITWAYSTEISTSEINAQLVNIEGAMNRAKNVEAAQKLKERLKEATDTHLVYTSSKNYTLNEGFEKGYVEGQAAGFQADTNVKLGTWEQMLAAAHLRSNELIRAAMQLIPGAIGEGQDENVSTMFARAIAGALFDDFDVSGHVSQTGAKVIHLLYLNGVYIPLSFYFDKLYHAFDEANKDFNRNSLIDVRITHPTSIQFPNIWYNEEGGIGTESPDYEHNESAWRWANPGQSPWQYQADIALEQTLVSFKFWARFKKDMEELGWDFITKK